MCLYVEKTHAAISDRDIHAFKVIIKGQDGKFHPYFETTNVIEFDKLLINDEKIHVSLGEAHFPYKHYVATGVFHTFADITQIIFDLSFPRELDNIYICEAIIPQGTEYFIGFSHSFTQNVEKTYGSHKIIYKNPLILTEWLSSYTRKGLVTP